MNMPIPLVVWHCQQPHLKLVANVKVQEKKLNWTSAPLPQLESDVLTRLSCKRKPSMMTSSLANIATVRSATPPTLLILSPNKRKNAKRPSNSATPLSSVKVKVPKNVKLFMNRTVKLDTI